MTVAWASQRTIVAALLLAALVITIFVVMINVWPLGADYYYHFRPTAELFLQGKTRLYESNPQLGYYNAPWTLIFLLPLPFVTLQVGQALMNVASLVGILVSIRLLQHEQPIPVFAIVFAVVNLHTFDVLIRGQVDVVPLVGAVLGYWAVRSQRPFALSLGFALMGTKPVNLALVFLLFLISIRGWSLAEKARALSLPLILCIASGFFIGFDWPLRYLQYVQAYPTPRFLNITLWRASEVLGLPVWPWIIVSGVAVVGLFALAWREGTTLSTFGLALATMFVFTTYATGNHYVLLIPPLVYLARKSWPLALLAYGLTWTPLARISAGYSLAWLDIGYPLLLFVALWLARLHTLGPEQVLMPRNDIATSQSDSSKMEL